MPDPVLGLFERATAGTARILEGVRPDQLAAPTPCAEWSVAEATSGTFMDQLVHTWDLATATGQDPTLVVEACIAMFLPEMPERGRAAGIGGPAVTVPAGAPAQDRLLAAMGRQP